MNNAKYFVYLLTFGNGKIYIGASKTDKKGNFTNRYRAHANAAKIGRELPIYDAWRELGAPTISILSIHEDRSSSLIAEINAIASMDAMNESVGYNIQAGGAGKIAFASERYREIMQEKVWSSSEWKRKISEAQQRPEHKKAASERTKQRMANGGAVYLKEKMKGRVDPRSAEGKILQRQKIKEYMATE